MPSTQHKVLVMILTHAAEGMPCLQDHPTRWGLSNSAQISDEARLVRNAGSFSALQQNVLHIASMILCDVLELTSLLSAPGNLWAQPTPATIWHDGDACAESGSPTDIITSRGEAEHLGCPSTIYALPADKTGVTQPHLDIDSVAFCSLLFPLLRKPLQPFLLVVHFQLPSVHLTLRWVGARSFFLADNRRPKPLGAAAGGGAAGLASAQGMGGEIWCAQGECSNLASASRATCEWQ